MTGIAFLKRLTFQLDFLNDQDKKTVLSFYEQKLQNAETLLEEEAIVRSFGTPEYIAKKLKSAYFSHLAAVESAKENERVQEISVSQNVETTEVNVGKSESDADAGANNVESEDDLIFSKQHAPQKSEMIHSLENKEVKTLYGEKVIIEDRIEPIEEIVIEPIDSENGLTEEEIRELFADP